ncbi:unnamed protein product [Prunus armeniaca]
MPMSHRIAMSFTRDAILFKSRVHGPNYEVGAQICDLSVLQLHARRSSSSSVGSAMCIASPRGARLQLTRRRKGTKRPTHCRNYCIGVVLNLLSVQWAPQPIGTGGPAGLRVAPGRGGDDKA